MCVGDEILELNGESLHGLSHDEALHKFKVRQLHYDSNRAAPLSSLGSMIRIKRWRHIHGTDIDRESFILSQVYIFLLCYVHVACAEIAHIPK